MADDIFGFGTAKPSTADRLKSVRPAEPRAEPAPADLARIDAVAERAGFSSREQQAPPAVAYRRKKDIGPTTAINMRAPQRVAVPFIKFCEENRYSYWEGVEELMRRCGMLENDQTSR